jgi:hypothetical protein
MVDRSMHCEIWVEGHLAPHRLRHFEGVRSRQTADGQTLIMGSFRDQSALFGLLTWLHGLGVVLNGMRRLKDNGLQGAAASVLQRE